MKTKYIKIISLLVLVMLPTLFIAQEASANKMLQFIKGDGAIEQAFLDGIEAMNSSLDSSATKYITLGKALGCLGVMIQFAWIGWGMFSGSRDWDVMPMIKPVILALLLINWTGFYKGIEAPFKALAAPSKTMFDEIEKITNAERVARYEKQRQITDEAIKLEAKTKKMARDAKYDLKDDGVVDKVVSTVVGGISKSVEEAWDSLTIEVDEMVLKTSIYLQKWGGELLEAIGLTFLRVCTYFIFFIQQVWSKILVIFGPIAFGMALIPGFENSLYSWISKFINVNLYTTIAYQIISAGQAVIIAAYKMENTRYGYIIDDAGVVKDEALLLAFISNSGFMHIILFSVVAYFVTGVAVLMTPTIADSIVSAGGAGVMSKMKNAGSALAGGANSSVKSVGKGIGVGASVGASVAKKVFKYRD